MLKICFPFVKFAFALFILSEWPRQFAVRNGIKVKVLAITRSSCDDSAVAVIILFVFDDLFLKCICVFVNTSR